MKREIEPVMFNFFEALLEFNGFAQNAIQFRNPRALLVEAAKCCVGIREATGKNDGPMIELMQETIGRAEGESWCMSFVQTCIAYVEKKMNITSPIVPGEHCLTVWGQTAKEARVKHTPGPGAIVIWKHGKGPSGHTGIVLASSTDDYFDAIEGNTESGLSDGEIVREGGGVYATRRKKGSVGSMNLVGYLKPF